MTDDNQARRGLALAIAAQLIWGFAALYWVQTNPLPATHLLAHRVLWSVPVLLVCVLVLGHLPQLREVLRKPRSLGVLALCAALSGSNWGVFLWAVTHGQATEASLGYFLLPLVSIAMGMVFFRESLTLRQWIAVSFAVAGLAVMLFGGAGFPWIALALSLSFGSYSAIRKAVTVGAVAGLLVETLFMAPVALYWVLITDGAGWGQYGQRVDLFLAGAGLLTATPLIAYVSATRMMPLSAMGLLSYLGPSTQLFVALWFLHEPISTQQITAFALVWTGLLLVSLDGFRRQLKRLFR